MEETVINGTTDEAPAIPSADSSEANPAVVADEQKTDTPEEAKPETPEQIESRRESRRARARARDAAAIAAAQTEARMLREQLDRLQRPAQSESSAEPVRDQYESLEDYTKALVKYEAEQTVEKRLRAERDARNRQEESAKSAQSEEQIAKDWTKKEADFAKVSKDYKEVVGAFIEDGNVQQMHEWARSAILESPVGPQVLYHLANNEDETERILALPKSRQVAAINALEAKFAAVPAKKVSDAPAPAETVRGGRSASTGLSENDSLATYMAKRKQQGARWAQ